MSTPKTIRVKSWEEFKKTAVEKNATVVMYVIAQTVPNRDYTGLKLVMHGQDAQYVFTDTAKDDKMRKTGIQVHTGNKGNRFLTDEDVTSFLKKSIEVKNLKIFSYWTA